MALAPRGDLNTSMVLFTKPAAAPVTSHASLVFARVKYRSFKRKEPQELQSLFTVRCVGESWHRASLHSVCIFSLILQSRSSSWNDITLLLAVGTSATRRPMKFIS